MLHYVHQLVSRCVCLLFAAEQEVYSGFFIETAACYKSQNIENQKNENAKICQLHSIIRTTAASVYFF